MGSAELVPPGRYHSQPEHIKVICCGAGAAGIMLAYRMQAKFTCYDLMCYDKNPEVGGTWYENRYPGCACDVPAHVYTFPFDQNPEWDSFYAYAPQILQYFKNFVVNHDLGKYIQLNSKIVKAVWKEEEGIYEVEIQHEGKMIKDWCNVFVNGTGFLNNWKWPNIEGLHSFDGDLVHSASWNPEIDWKDKTVAVIGTGSSAIQIVPQIQKTAKHLIAFMRSVTWISPPVAGDALAATKLTSTSSEQKERSDAQYYYTDEDKERFRKDSASLLTYRKNMENGFNAMFDFFIKDSEAQITASTYMKAEMLRRLGPGHEELKEKLIPKWSPGCRRITPGDGYLEALVKSNVTTVHEEIVRIVPEGLVDASGMIHKVDIIICATGFNLAFAPPFTVQGTNGVDMAAEFDPEPNVYLGLAVPKFPNYFVVNGVRGNWSAGSVLPTHETQIDYIVACVKRIQTEGIKALEIKEEPTVQLNKHIDEWHPVSVWSDKCKSWYKNNIPGGKLWIWGGSGLHYLKSIKMVRWEHYDFRYKSNNMWDFLGNGYTAAQAHRDFANLAPYIRTDADQIWDIE